MRALYLTLALPLLIGCSATQERIVTKTITVEVPVVARCKAPMPDRPQFELDRVSVKDDLYHKGKAALIEIQQRKAYEEKLKAAAEACR